MPDTTTTPFAPATATRLVGAYFVDLAVLGALAGATWFVYFTPLTITFITVEAVVASAIMLGATGRTPGMAAMRVCLIRDETDAQTPSLGAALAYTAMTVALQLTVVGPLAALAMVRDGHTWLTGATRTRLVDLRKHAALATGPAAVGMGEGADRPRPGQAPSGFDSVHTSPVSQEWGAPTSPLMSAPHAIDYSVPGVPGSSSDSTVSGYAAPGFPGGSTVPDYSAPGGPDGSSDSTVSGYAAPGFPGGSSGAGSSSGPGVSGYSASGRSAGPSGPSGPGYAASQQGVPPTVPPRAPVPPASSDPSLRGALAPQVPAAPAPSREQSSESTQFDAILAPASDTSGGSGFMPEHPAPPRTAVSGSRVPPAAPPGNGDVPGRQVPAQPAQASYAIGQPESDAAGQYAPRTSGVPAPPPSRRAYQAARRNDPDRLQGGAPAASTSSPLLWLIFDSGQRELIDAPLTLGRAPASDEGSRAVVVPDTTVSLSRTHMRVGPAASGAWIEDAFSANGTQIRTPDGRIAALAGGQAVEVPAGTEILMGERRATIVYADADSVR
ncbi:translation initiation factor 2 [Actinomyces sp. HMSC062G12]|nr:translation initiation factor 2 [Actinomyces sp. HMSC062G12]